MSDQIIDAVAAQALHADACRDHPIVGWVVMRDQPEPGRQGYDLATARWAFPCILRFRFASNHTPNFTAVARIVPYTTSARTPNSHYSKPPLSGWVGSS